jgi:hypothetical protein
VETENLLPPPDDFEPSQPAPPRRLRRFFLVVSLLLVVAVATVGLLIVPAPAFHRERLPPGGPLAGRPASVAAAAAEQDARRLVTAVSGLHADIMGVGPWEALFTERQINAWLAVDLPRNHPELLTGGVTGPRVEFLPGRVRAAVRLGREPLAASIWIEAEVRLREVNQLGISLRAAGLGLVTEIRRLDDQRLLLVYIPSTHEAGGLSHWLRRLGITAGELVVTGETRRGPLRPAAE